MWTETDGSDEVIDLAIAFPIDHSTRLTLSATPGGTRETAPLVPMFDGFDIAKVSGEAVEL
jgi:hypothetical protein